MVDAPPGAMTSTIWQAALAKPEFGEEIMEQTFRSHPLLRFFWNGEIKARENFKSATNKIALIKNGYKPKHIKYSALRAIERQQIVDSMATVGAIALADAVTQTADTGLPTNPLRVLTGDYGLVYGVSTSGLEEEVVRGGIGAIHEWGPIVQKDLAQQLSAALSTGLYSDGTSDKIDGLAMWRAVTGTKWGSQSISATDKYLQGQAASFSIAQFTYMKFIELVDQARYGAIEGTNSDGRKPNVCLMTTALFRKLKGWLYDKSVINQPEGGQQFVDLGTPEDYVMIDGVCCFADDHLDGAKSSNFGLLYMFNTNDFELIFHKDFNFVGVDAYKETGSAPEAFKRYNLPSYVWKNGIKKLILVNMYNKRPRNLLYATVTT